MLDGAPTRARRAPDATSATLALQAPDGARARRDRRDRARAGRRFPPPSSDASSMGIAGGRSLTAKLRLRADRPPNRRRLDAAKTTSIAAKAEAESRFDDPKLWAVKKAAVPKDASAEAAARSRRASSRSRPTAWNVVGLLPARVGLEDGERVRRRRRALRPPRPRRQRRPRARRARTKSTPAPTTTPPAPR